MFQKNDLKALVNGILQNKQKDTLPYWKNDTKLTPLKEVVVVNNPVNAIKKKTIVSFYTQNAAFEIKVASSSCYPSVNK